MDMDGGGAKHVRLAAGRATQYELDWRQRWIVACHVLDTHIKPGRRWIQPGAVWQRGMRNVAGSYKSVARRHMQRSKRGHVNVASTPKHSLSSSTVRTLFVTQPFALGLRTKLQHICILHSVAGVRRVRIVVQ